MENHYPEIFGQYVGQKRDGSYDNVDFATKQAADICGGCQSSSEAAKGPEPVGREERTTFGEKVKPIEEAALRVFAIDQNSWFTEKNFLDKYKSRFIGSGAEQKVYLSEDGFDTMILLVSLKMTESFRSSPDNHLLFLTKAHRAM